MTDTTPEPEDVERVLAEFESRRDKLEAFCAKAKGLIEEALEDAAIRYQSVQARVKSKRKLREKYLDPTKGYRKLDDITDLAGLRVITYYEDEVDQVAEIIKREFKIDPERSIDKRKTDPDRFGYHALNYICCHAKKRLEDVEYKKYAGVWCEIQITSILRHAWSEIEHEWYDLREAYPDEIKRRFYRLVGVFELVESEFIDLKKKRSDYQKSMDIQVEVEVPDVPVDVVSMKSLIGQNSLIAELDRAVSERLDLALSEDIVDSLVETVSKAAILAGLSTVNQVRTSLERYKNAILEYVGRAWELSATSRADPSTRSMRGISVFQLALLLIGARSEEGLREAMGKLLEVNTTAGGRMHKLIQTRAAIAREVLLKYAPPTDGSL